MKLNRDEKLILSELFKSSEGLIPFTIYKRYNMSPGIVYSFIERFSSLGLIENNLDKLILTDKGTEFVIRRSFDDNPNKQDKYSKIPLEFLTTKIKINEFYLPNAEFFVEDFLNSQKTRGKKNTSI